MSSSGRGTLRLPTSTGYVEFPSYTFPNNILTKNLFGFADLTMNGCTVKLTNTACSIYDDTNNLIWYTPKDPNSREWKLDLATFLPNVPTTKQQSGNGMGTSELNTIHVAAHSIKHTTDAERVAYGHACFGFPPI